MEIEDLLELTVDEQKDKLENLDIDQLTKLESEEERNTAISNIQTELRKREKPEEYEDKETNNKKQKNELDVSVETKLQRLEQLEKKIDYILEKSKTVSHEGFENYEN